MSIATRKFKIVNIIFNKSLFDNNIIHMILNHYWNMLDNKHKTLLAQRAACLRRLDTY
jgi:hypothetical protein